MGMPDDSGMDVVLMADPRVTAIPVRDIGEGLVDLRTLGLRISSALADDAGAFAHVRTGVASRLLLAAEALPDPMEFLIFEGYRPLALQQQFFDNYLAALRTSDPDSAPERLRMLTSRYVSPPEISPHSAGAAVDLTLCTTDGDQLDLGTRYDATPEESGGACFTHHPALAENAKHNRAILTTALNAAGFVNYPTEWWHWSYGDRYWAMATGAPQAIYGPCQLPSPSRPAH
jgi:D-alanyl-D-alanine dipeptidase